MTATSATQQLKILYDEAFTAIENGKKYETLNKLIEAKQHYVEGIQKFMQCIEMESNAKKKQMLKESVSAFLDTTEKIQQRLTEQSDQKVAESLMEPGSPEYKYNQQFMNKFENDLKIKPSAPPKIISIPIDKNQTLSPAKTKMKSKPKRVPNSAPIPKKTEQKIKNNKPKPGSIDNNINVLISMGFDKEAANAALIAHNNDVQIAAHHLFESKDNKSKKCGSSQIKNRSQIGSKSPNSQRNKQNHINIPKKKNYSKSVDVSPCSSKKKKLINNRYNPSKNKNSGKSKLEKRLGYKPNKSKPKKPILTGQEKEIREKLERQIINNKDAAGISFKDVQGLKNVKLALYETIILPSLRPDLFTGLREPTSGLLLFGPPGNGKTLIAKCVASECNATFFNISASSITSKWVGEGEKFMKGLFALAEQHADKGNLSIIFIDEIDSLLTARGGKNEAESSRRIKTEFLVQFDGVKKKSQINKRILVIGATNLPWQLDDAVLRRFGKRICVPLPDIYTRKGLLIMLLDKQQGNHCLNDLELNKIVKETKGYSCSDLTVLCKDAAMGPIRELGSNIIDIKSSMDIGPINMKHFNDSIENIKPSTKEESLKEFDVWNEKYGSKINLSNFQLPDCMKPEQI